jgi:hypothetical protein
MLRTEWIVGTVHTVASSALQLTLALRGPREFQNTQIKYLIIIYYATLFIS